MVANIYINEVDIIKEKLFNIFILPNKKEWRDEFEEYLNIFAVFIKKYFKKFGR